MSSQTDLSTVPVSSTDLTVRDIGIQCNISNIDYNKLIDNLNNPHKVMESLLQLILI